MISQRASLTMLILVIAALFTIVNGAYNNIPQFDPTKRVFDCTVDPSTECSIRLVVEPLTTMTYYNFSDGARELRAYRATYNSSGTLQTLIQGIDVTGFQPPITANGYFRSVITVNGLVPGPTIIVNENQVLNITVYNEMKDHESISIHWHGMYMRQPSEKVMDGVTYITQYPILPFQSYSYVFTAYPSGTHWYHAHSGAHRTDGLYGALIVKEPTYDESKYGIDMPEDHTLMFIDWIAEGSAESVIQDVQNLKYWKEPLPVDGPYQSFSFPLGPDRTGLGSLPFLSGLVNDKGRLYDESGNHNNAELNYFNVTSGNRYRFRLIGAQAEYAFRFSIQGHKLTVIATDGSFVESIEDVDYVIVSSGERFDVTVNANQPIGNYWILAETLEVNNSDTPVFHNPIDTHKAEAFLHYDTAPYPAMMTDNSETWNCTASSKCHAVNCPFTQYGNIMNCTNVDEFEFPANEVLPVLEPTGDTLFYSFGFDGEATRRGSSVDGVNFRFPSDPPLTEYNKYVEADNQCPGRGCDNDKFPHCACTHVIDINQWSEGDVIQMVITNRRVNPMLVVGTSHPVHLHGHHFHVVRIGYPTYDNNGVATRANEEIECVVAEDNPNSECNRFITVEGKQYIRWTNSTPPTGFNPRPVRKDTVVVPLGGYVVIRFIVDNPGWWLFHCHTEPHQIIGMAAVVSELRDQLPQSLNVAEECRSGQESNVRVAQLCMLLMSVLAVTLTTIV